MSSTETRFYIELPGDEYGNTAWPTAVIEAQVLPAGREPATKYDNTDRPRMIVTGPAEIASRWPSCYADQYGGFAETEGPARMLSRDEYNALLKGIREREEVTRP
ncbi:MAG TPA: hypothetical protein VFQ68_12615 [Streptosporangiaceae bacterium]|nr:hypothetical protein [Streptosporangiaceae bacterium]